MLLCMISAGCTFYTSPGQCTNPNPGAGAGAGDSNAGGSANNGGASGDGPVVGTPMGEWVNVTSNLAGLDSMCGNSGLIVTKPDTDQVIAGIAQQGLWSSTDAGQSWGQVRGSTKITMSLSAVIFDPMDSTRQWVVGNHAPPYLFGTTDDGKTFNDLTEGSDLPGLDYVSVDYADPKRDFMLVGWHEIAQGVSRSTDGGKTWESIGKGLPKVFCSTPVVIDAQTYLVGCQDGQIMRTTDGAKTWVKVSDQGSNRAPVQASDGVLYWVSIDGSLVASDDSGETWQQILVKGTLVGNLPPLELPDGRIAAFGDNGIVAGTRTGAWKRVTVKTPYLPYTIAYSALGKAFYFAYGDCTKIVPDDAIQSYAFDYEVE